MKSGVILGRGLLAVMMLSFFLMLSLRWAVGATVLERDQQRPPCYTLRRHHLDSSYPVQRDSIWRPTSTGSIVSEIYPIRVHRRRLQDHWKLPIVLEAAERAWQIQVESAGFAEPFPDGNLGGGPELDIYLTNEYTEGGAWTDCNEWWPDCSDADTTDGRMGTSAYFAIDEGISAYWLPSYTAHEFNHVLQFATDFIEPTLPLWEGTATAAEDWCYEEDDTYLYTVPYYQKVPWASSILHDGYFLEGLGIPHSYYEYGAATWIFYVDDFFGNGTGTAAADLWWACAQEGSVNEPDVLDAFALVSGTTTVEAVLDFWLWRLLVGRVWTEGGIEEGEHWGKAEEISIDAFYRASSLPDGELEPSVIPYDLGGFYCAVLNDLDGLPGLLEISVNGKPNRNWGLVYAAFSQPPWSADITGKVRALPGDTLGLELDITPYTFLLFGIVNLGPEGFDGDQRPRRAPVTYNLHIEETVPKRVF